MFHPIYLKFVGHILDKGGISADSEETKATMSIKAQPNLSELHCFVCTVNQLEHLLLIYLSLEVILFQDRTT